MRNTPTNTQDLTDDELDDAVLDIIVAAGFVPSDDTDVPLDLDWLPRYGFAAYRVEGDDTMTLVRWGDGIDLVRSTRNYLIMAEARFDLSSTGLAWFTAVVTA